MGFNRYTGPFGYGHLSVWTAYGYIESANLVHLCHRKAREVQVDQGFPSLLDDLWHQENHGDHPYQVILDILGRLSPLKQETRQPVLKMPK